MLIFQVLFYKLVRKIVMCILSFKGMPVYLVGLLINIIKYNILKYNLFKMKTNLGVCKQKL